MGKYLYTQKEFELVAQIHDLCCALNENCVGQSHCKDRWDDFMDDIIPYYPIEKYAQTRENHGRTAYDPSDNYFVPYMIKDLLRRLC